MTAFSEFCLLFRIHARQRLGLSALKVQRRTKKGLWTQIGIGAAIVYAVATMLVLYGLILHSFMKTAVGIGIADVLFGMVILATMIMALVLGTLSLLGLVFNAKDTGFYASLPVRQRSVFAAKFGMVYITELAATAFFLLPAAFFYSWYADTGVLFWCKTALVVLLAPAVPLAVSSILSIPLMLLSSKFKNRDLIATICGIALVLAVVVGEMALTKQMNIFDSPEEAMVLLTDSQAMLKAVVGAFPPAMWAAQGAILAGTQAIAPLLLFVASVAVSTVLALWLSDKLYYKGALAQLESLRKSSKGYIARGVKVSSAFKAIFVKEFKLLFRTPVYAMNSFMSVLIFPIMILAMGFGGSQMSELDELFAQIGLLKESMALVIAALMALFTIINPAVTTTFSREGRRFWFVQSIPVPASTQVAARAMVGGVIAAAGALVGVASIWAIIRFDVFLLVYILPMALAGVWPAALAGLIPDCVRPKLKWNSEAEAMKQNMNSMAGMLTSLLSLVLPVVFAILMNGVQAPLWMTAAGIVLICVAEGLCLNAWAVKLTEKLIRTSEG